MKKLTGKMLILLLACLVLLQTAGLAEDGFSTSYTYTYDYWEDVQESPDAYRVATVIDSMSLGLENLENIRINKAQSLFVRNQFIYVCDTNNNRILEIERKGNSFSLSRVIREIQGAEINTFSTPYDVFVDEDYNLYVADYGNQRVVSVVSPPLTKISTTEVSTMIRKSVTRPAERSERSRRRLVRQRPDGL